MGHKKEYAVATLKTQEKMNHIRETYNYEEESEPEKIRHVTQINRKLPDKNDHQEIKVKINGKQQNFTIDAGSSVTIMLNNSKKM